MPDPATPTTPTLLKGCNDTLTVSDVTREFDFGQFIELFDSTPDQENPNRPVLARIVIDPAATLVADRNASTGASKYSTSAPIASARSRLDAERQVHLFDLIERGAGAKLPPIPVEIRDVGELLSTGRIQADGRTFVVPVQESMRERLSSGLRVTVFGTPADDTTAPPVPIALTMPFEPLRLGEQTLAQVLAGERISTSFGEIRPMLDEGAVRALLEGRTVLTHATDGDGKRPIALSVEGRAEFSDRFEIFDLPAFLSSPSLPGGTGTPSELKLPSDNIRQLLGNGRTQLTVSGRTLDLEVVEPDREAELREYRNLADTLRRRGNPMGSEVGLPPAKPAGTSWTDLLERGKRFELGPHFVHPLVPDRFRIPEGGNGGRTTPTDFLATPSLIDKVQTRMPTGTGLPIAVFVPWKQTWTQTGYSRGNLLHSIALAPQEEVTLQVFSWERRTRALEQSSETEAEQETDVGLTTRDTEDTFREMVSQRDFAWQLSASLDASYSTTVASIQAGADFAMSDTTSLQDTARNSSQQVRESTVKASARVRSRRFTRITQTVETGREERVTRVIRNPNQCRSLTLDFFEALAHYKIKLEFVPQRLRLVVLVPNPIRHRDFSSEIVRRNETTLRNALIESALVDGFDACRMVAAYKEAKDLLPEQKAEGIRSDEMSAQRDQAAPPSVEDPAAPQLAEVERIAKAMIQALVTIRANADIDAAVSAIIDEDPVSEDARRNGQYWLFINFCASKFPALLTTLDDLSENTVAPLEAAQKIAAVLPGRTSQTTLATLNEMSDRAKEEAGIESKLREPQHLGNGGLWWLFTGRMKEEGLFTSNDAGLAGLAEQLQKALLEWETKKVQGSALKNQDVARTEAEGRQDKATTEDRLSMAFPLEELARALEREKVLRDHLTEHREFYNYALFLALPPAEQALRIVEATSGSLPIGLFEPRVVAMNGSRLAVPLAPTAATPKLNEFVTKLRNSLTAVFQDTLKDVDTTVLPTPGVSVATRLGDCSGCEEYIEKARRVEIRRLSAIARQEMWEATRRERLIGAENYEDFNRPAPSVKLEVENTTAPTP